MSQSIPFYKRIQFRLLSIIIAVILLGSIHVGYVLYQQNNDETNKDIETLITTFINTYQQEVDSSTENLSVAMEFLVRDPNIVEALAKRDRDRLYALTVNLYETKLKPLYGIRQFQFHLPPAQSFLRVHMPSMFGDDLSAFRQTVLQVNRQHEPAKGIEVGTGGLGLRIVYPVTDNGTYVGSVELGASLTNALNDAAGITGADFAIGINRNTLETANRIANQSADILVDNLAFNQISNPDIIPALFQLNSERIKISNRTYVNKSIPLKDASGTEVGKIVILKDISGVLSLNRQKLISIILIEIAFAASLCLAIIFFLKKNYIQPIKQSMGLARAMAHGDFNYKVEISGNSEIELMLSTFNQSFKKMEGIQDGMIRSAQLASIGELSASVAHEINNPINGVISYCQILLNQNDLSDKQRDLITRTQKEGGRVAAIVRNMLYYARDSKGARDYHDVSQTVIDSLVLLHPDMKKLNVEIEFEWGENLPQVFCNPQQIEQIIINIFRNANHALADNAHGNRKIIVSTGVIVAENRNYLQLIIANNGPHIPKNIIDKIIKPFFTTKAAGVGTGLGLSVSTMIMKEHEGFFEVESVPGGATKMILRFPVQA